MVREIEAAALDSVGAVVGRRPAHTLALGTPCPNCATPLAGAWCHGCGQSAEDFHRSLWRLAIEAVSGFFDVDSRLWRTLPKLFLNPARLTRDYLDGRRASQAPPFRLFLIVVVLVFLVGGLESGPRGARSAPLVKIDSNSTVNIDNNAALNNWVVGRLKAAASRPGEFEAALTSWAQRLVFLALPLAAGLMGLMFFWRRGVYLFDHLIFSMHSLSFLGMLVAVVMVGERLGDAFGWLLFAAPVHLFAHMKGTYRIGVFATLARMLVLFIGSLVGFAVILLGLFAIGLYEVGA